MDVKPLVDSKGDIDESVVREEDDDEEDIVIDAIEGQLSFLSNEFHTTVKYK